MPSGPRAVPDVVAVATRAAWRPALLGLLVVAVPAAAVHAVLSSVGLPGVGAVPAAALGALFGASLIVHEGGHAVAVLVLARTDRAPDVVDPAEMLAAGTWSSGRIVRWSFGAQGDAVIAAAGPAAGSLCAIPALAVASTAPWTLPLVTLFAVHLLALRPRHPDGAQLADALWERTPS